MNPATEAPILIIVIFSWGALSMVTPPTEKASNRMGRYQEVWAPLLQAPFTHLKLSQLCFVPFSDHTASAGRGE
jgi:hypothetical protein